MAEPDREVAAAAAVLRRGGLVVYPTETFYALGALARDGGAVSRLARAKGRAEGKPLPLIAASRAQLDEVAVLGGIAERIAARFWPGPLTLVLPSRPGLPVEVTLDTGTVAVRIPGSEVGRALARAAGGALVSTSANPAGEAPPASVASLSPALAAAVDVVLDLGPTPGGAPSTIVRFEGEAAVLVRAGAISFEEVLAAAG